MLNRPVEDTTAYQLPALPYTLTALEPFLSRETLEYHYGKHHLGYIDKLNVLVPGTAYEGLSIEELVRESFGAIYRNAAQAWNHEFYWRGLTPRPLAPPVGRFASEIDHRFGSFAEFSAQFRKSALDKFGSGWTWLVRGRDASLEILNTDDADNPMRHGATPLLVCDVWEHAYYIDYRNDRGSYLDAFWKCVDWRIVAANAAR